MGNHYSLSGGVYLLGIVDTLIHSFFVTSDRFERISTAVILLQLSILYCFKYPLIDSSGNHRSFINKTGIDLYQISARL